VAIVSNWAAIALISRMCCPGILQSAKSSAKSPSELALFSGMFFAAPGRVGLPASDEGAAGLRSIGFIHVGVRKGR
jgi:hypothetical protein